SDATNWQLVNAPPAGTTVAPGHNVDVTIQFVAQSAPGNQSVDETNDVTSTPDNLPPSQTGGVYDGTLTINSNDPTTPASTVQLAGYWQYESEHEEEPNLQTIVNRMFGYGTDISNTPLPQYPNNGSTVTAYGEEVMSGLWQAADPSQPVNVLQLAAYHTQLNPSDSSSFLTQLTTWYSPSDPAKFNTLFSHADKQGQSVLPQNAASSGPAQGSFAPGNNTFGFDLDGEYSQDSLNTTDINSFGRSGHAIRFYPARDASGNLIPNTWIMGMDYQNAQFDNSDFQDGVWLVQNVRPATQAPAVTNLKASSSAGQVTLQWTAVKDTSLQGYNVYRSETAGGSYIKLNSSPVTGTSFVDSSPAGAKEYYQVSAVDSAGESEKAATSIAVDSSPSGGGGTGDGPDLTVSAVTGKLASSVVGNSRSGPTRVTVTNSGNQTAKGTIEIDEFLSTSATDVTGATEVVHVTRNVNLKAGKSTPVVLPGFKYPSSLNGQYFIVAQVKDIKGITESDTTNNTGASSAINIAPAFIDLHNLFAGSLPSTLVPGKRTRLQVPVINDGNSIAKGVATFTITASTNAQGTNGTTLATIKRPIALAAGKTGKYNLSFLVPTLSSGTYFVVTNVSLSGDANASNNTGVSTGTFTV
ncbi:MAG TPA: fibronectin type III domain-containing protein, partial [Tepidisphaeraceae bacterium]